MSESPDPNDNNAPVFLAGKTDIACIIALIMSVLGFVSFGIFSLIGLVTSVVAWRRASRFGLKGKGLAIAGVILSALGMAALCVLFIFAFRR